MNRQQQLAAAIQRQQALVDAARAANRSLSAEEQAQFNAAQAEIDQLRAAIAEEQRQNPSNGNPAPAAPTSAVTPAPEGTPTPAQESNPTAGTPVDARALIEGERSRIADITAMCRDFNMDPANFIANGSTVDQVRTAILENLRTNRSPIPAGVRVIDSGEDQFRADAATALLLRCSRVSVDNPSAGAQQMRGMSLRDLAIECLSREGQHNATALLRMSSDDLYVEVCRQFYNPTAAFPAILDDTIRKSIVHLYNHVPTTFQLFTTTGTLKDFKQTADHEYVIGGVGDWLLVPENGEIKPDLPRTERLPQRKLDTYGKQFSMTRQAFINDDIGFLTEVPGLYATAAKKTIDKQVYKLLFDNKPVFDGKNFFCKEHKNLLTTGSKPSQASIQNMILLMQQQQDHFGEPIYMTPRTLIVPTGYEFDLSVIFHSAQVVGSNNNDYNPLHNYPLQVVQSPMLNALAGEAACPWFLAPDRSSALGIQVDYLNGQETPTVRRMETPGQLGFVWDMWLDWGIAVRDFRGFYRNPGEVIKAVE